MAFCPECGKSATAEATRCVYCGHEIENKAAAAKGAGARFKGTMMMAASPVAKPAAKPAAAQPAPAAAPAQAPAPVAAAPVAAAPAPAVSPAQAPAKFAAKATMIGTGIDPAVAKGAFAKPAVAKPATPAAAPAPAPAQPVAAAPAAAPAAEAKRNMAFAQTQVGAMFVPQAKAAPAAAPAPESMAVAATPMAPRPEPEPEPELEAAAAVARPQYDADDDENYVPNQPDALDEPVRAPVLRFNESMPELPRVNPLQDKKMLWIAAGVIGVLCLGLLIVLMSKLSN